MNTMYAKLISMGLISGETAREARRNLPACGNFSPCQAGALDEYLDYIVKD